MKGALREGTSREQRVAFALGLALVLAFVFGAPVLGATSPGGVAMQGNPQSGYIHYQVSLGCRLVGVGVMYWQGSLSVGCVPLVV